MALYRFGPFCLAPVERRLWRGDDDVHLTPKAFDLLVVLVRGAGHLLSREELLDRLWGDTVIEEHGLTWNISALRRALGDVGESPVYIETVRGHGYRFVAHVQVENEAAGEAPASPATVLAPAPVEAAAPAPAVAGRHVLSRRPPMLWLLLPACLIALAALAALVLQHHNANTASTTTQAVHRPRLAVVGFRNLSGNHDYDWIGDALTEMLGTDMAAGDKVTLIPSADVMRARRNLKLTLDGAQPTSEQMQILRRALGADASITGAYLRQDGNQARHLRVDVRLIIGSTHQSVTYTATGDDLFTLVSQLGQRLRQRLGMQGLTSAQQGEFMASMPANTAAAADYASGLSALASGQALLARTLLQKVTGEEPEFPLAHSALARAWLQLGDNHNASAEARLALRHSAGLSYNQRQLLLGLQAEAEHDWDGANNAYSKLFNSNPGSLNIGLMLVRVQDKGGHYADARRTLGLLTRLAPPFGNDPRVMLASANLYTDMGQYDNSYRDSMQAAKRANALGQDAMQASAFSHAAYALIQEDKYDAALALANRARKIFAGSDPDSLEAGINLQRIGIAYDDLGQFDRAISEYGDANELFARIGNLYWQAASLNNIAGVYYRRDQLELAGHSYKQALDLFLEVHRDSAVAVVLDNLSAVLSSEGQVEQAAAYGERSLALYRKLGAPLRIATTLLNLGLHEYALGHFDQASQQLRESRDLYLAQHRGNDASDAISALADLARVRNHLDAARKGYEQALEMRRRAHAATSVAWSERDLAELDMMTHHPRRALQRLHAALPVFDKAGAHSDAIVARVDLAVTMALLGRLDEARANAKQLDKLIPAVSDRGTRVGLEISRARLARHLGDISRAKRLLADALSQARQMKYQTLVYRARLEAMRLQASLGLDAAGRRQAAALARDAQRDGFDRVAAQALSLLRATPRPS